MQTCIAQVLSSCNAQLLLTMVSMRHNYYIHPWAIGIFYPNIQTFDLLHQSACIMFADTASKGNFHANNLGHLSVEPLPPIFFSTKSVLSLKALNAGLSQALMFESRH